TAAQRKITEINQLHLEQGFKVELITWDRLQDLLDEHLDLKEDLYPSVGSQSLAAVKDEISGVRGQLTELSRNIRGSLDVDIEHSRNALEQHEYQLARVLAQHVRQQRWNDLTLQDKTRVLSIIGIAYAMERDTAKAMAALEESYILNPTDERVGCNRAF